MTDKRILPYHHLAMDIDLHTYLAIKKVARMRGVPMARLIRSALVREFRGVQLSEEEKKEYSAILRKQLEKKDEKN